MPTSSLQRQGFYKLLPYNEALIDSTASRLALSPFLVEYATLRYSTLRLNFLLFLIPNSGYLEPVINETSTAPQSRGESQSALKTAPNPLKGAKDK